MYRQFYSFNKEPFPNVPDPSALFMSPTHKKALSVLEYAIRARAGFCVVSGGVGTGKTTLIRKILQETDADLEIGLVTTTQFEDFEEFLKWILLSFGLDYDSSDKVTLYDRLTKFLIQQYQAGRPATLIIDEAQHLKSEQLEQLRMLSNINTEKGLILQTILVGQPELWANLQKHELRQFAQRISYDVRLEPLENPEVIGEYIRHRLVNSGGSPNTFEPETYDYIYLTSMGVPRLVNLICDTALVYGYADQKFTIDAEIIEKVINDKSDSLAPTEDWAIMFPLSVAEQNPANSGSNEDVDSQDWQTTAKQRNEGPREKIVSTFKRAEQRYRKISPDPKS